MRKLLLVGLMMSVSCFGVTTYWYDNFESNPHGLNSTSLNNWQVNGSVDVVGPGLYDISSCYSGTHCIDLDGTSNAMTGGSISRSFEVLRTGPLLLTWFNSGSQRNYPGFSDPFSWMHVEITDGINTRQTTYQLRYNHPWTAHAMPFNAESTDIQVRFTGFNNQWVGILLDDIYVIDPRNGAISTNTHTPEPASFAMLGLGLIAVGLYKRR